MNLLIVSIVMGIVSFGLATGSCIPQLISLIKTRNTSGISLVSYIILNVDNIIWIVWTFGFYFNSMYMYSGNYLRLFQISLLVLVFSYIFGSILVSSLLVIKINHLIKIKKLNITELQLAKLLVNNDKNKYFVNKKWNNGKRYLPVILFIIIDLIFSLGIVVILWFFGYVQPIEGTKDWPWVIVLGFVCSGIWEATCWPQLVKSIKEKDMTGISLFWVLFALLNCISSFTYDATLAFGSGKFSYDMIFILIFSAIAPNLGILILKVKNIVKAKKAGMTELEYTNKVLIPLVKNKQKNKNK